MTYAEFSLLVGGGWYDQVEAACQVPGCNNVESCKKGSALNNFKRNGIFKCRSCAYTEEGKKRMGEAASYKRSEATKKLMSESANKKWQTVEGQELKKRLSKLTSKQHGSKNFDKSKRKVLYISAKNGNDVRVCNSSYELIACEDYLEKDEQVVSYESQVPYEVEGRGRSLDFLVTYTDGSKKVIEVKPKKRMTEEFHVLQIYDSRANARKNCWAFELWTERNLNIKRCKEATARADAYRKEHQLVDYASYRRQKDNAKAKKHYDTKIGTDKVIVFCTFCKTYHSRLRVTYDKNIKKNGRFICIRENGRTVGRKPKKTKENPYAILGQKQCNRCFRVLPLDCFGLDKHKKDGYATRCKECRAEVGKQRYQRGKHTF